MKKMLLILWLGLLMTLVSCVRLPFLPGPPARETETQPSITPTSHGATSTPTPPPDAQETSKLTLWVPPQFDPQGETTSGDLFQKRLDDFVSQRPALTLDVRVKALSGTGGMLDSLQVAEDAAPLVLPDLILLPRPLMEQAAEKTVITPLTPHATFLEGESWFSFARELSNVNDEIYGIPTAVDILVMAYKSDNIDEPPREWEALLSTQRPLAFSAADPQAVVSLGFYESLGGNIAHIDQSVVVDFGPLRSLLTFYQQAYQAGVMPYWLTQFETDQQAWNAYTERQSSQVITWSSHSLQSDSSNTSLAAVPTQDGKPFSYATGWMWCVVNTSPEGISASLDLIEHLTQERFLADWTAAAGYVPPRKNALAVWLRDIPQASDFEQVLPATRAVPSQQVLDQLGPILQDAVLAVLKDQVDPDQALSDIRDQLNRD